MKKLVLVLVIVGIGAWMYRPANHMSAAQPQGASVSVQYLPLVMKNDPPPTDTPVPSPTPTATSVATATTPPTGVYILNNSSTYVDSINYRHVVGEVMNGTGDTIQFVKPIVDFYNSSGGLIANDYTYTTMFNLPSHTKTCFEVDTSNPAAYSYYQFEAPGYSIGGQPVDNLTIVSPSGSYDPTFGYYNIIGFVRNDSSVTVKYVEPIGTVYNAAQTVVGCDYTFVNSTDLTAGQSSSFTLQFIGRDYADVDSYRIQVDGIPQ